LDDATYDLGAEGEPAATPRRPGFPVEPRRLLRIIAANRKPLLKAFLISAAVALVGVFFVPKTYESAAHLLFEGTPLLDPERGAPAPGAFVQTAVAPNRLREVRDRLGWDVSLDDLYDMTDVSLDDGAAMVIAAEAGTAEKAYDLARAVLDVFLARQASFNSHRLETLTAENQAALVRAEERREEAIKAYDAFRKKSGRPDLIREQEQLLERAADFRAKADEASVEIAAQQARIAELEKAQRELPAQIIASATKGSPVDSPLSQARSDLAEARSSLSAHHPTVKALKQRVASLQAQRKGQAAEIGERTLAVNPARAAVDQELATSRAELAGARERESALRVLLDANSDEAESLALGEGEARQVIGELELAETRFEELTERAADLRDASLTRLTGFRVLSVPMLPEDAERSPEVMTLLALLPVVAVLIFALVIIVRQLRGLTVVAPCEVAWWGNGPVLGTSVWPRDSNALEPFVAELEDHGVYGSGRTLVVPASETEREIACSFAVQLAEAPWLAAAILDVGDRATTEAVATPLVTPSPGVGVPTAGAQPKRLSSQGVPSVSHGRVVRAAASRPPANPTMQGFVPPKGGAPSLTPVVTPPPASEGNAASSSRPPRKKTMIGLPAVGEAAATRISTESTSSASPEDGSSRADGPPVLSGPEPFRRRRGARASVRIVMPGGTTGTSASATAAQEPRSEEDAFLLTRPVPVTPEQDTSTVAVGQAVPVGAAPPEAQATNAVMRAAVRLLGDDDDEVTGLQRTDRPSLPVLGDVTGVALAWNGPLSGPVLRRAARLAHRVMVVVSSGMSAVELTRLHTRLGRKKGVGYVLVNLDDVYVDLHDRVGSVEEFWEGARDADPKDSRLP
jgi:hypothetical protein